LEGDSLDQKLAALTQRLQSALSDRLVCVILYGSAVAGDWNQQRSDLNIVCALTRLSPEELALAEPIVRWWRDQKNPAPLLLTVEEIKTSGDCFPMEFHDMREHRRVLYGPDLIAETKVDRVFYRAQVEHELRSKQIRLRQKAAEVLSDSPRLVRLLTDSVSTFCVLGRHALLLNGNPGQWKKREILSSLETVLGRPFPAFGEILALRETGSTPPAARTTTLLESYLHEIDALVGFVDGLAK
jgi:hypothetical protein